MGLKFIFILLGLEKLELDTKPPLKTLKSFRSPPGRISCPGKVFVIFSSCSSHEGRLLF